MSSKPFRIRRLLSCSVILVALAAGSCTFIGDEFIRLDRAGPVADGPHDAVPSTTSARDGQ